MLPGWGGCPGISSGLTFYNSLLIVCWKCQIGWQKSHLFIPFLRFSRFQCRNLRKPGNVASAFIRYFTIPLISFISGLSWISLSRSSTDLANTSPVLDSIQGYRWLSGVTWARRPLCHFRPASRKERTAAAFVIPPFLLWVAKIQVWEHEASTPSNYVSLIWPKLWGKNIQDVLELMELKEDQWKK